MGFKPGQPKPLGSGRKIGVPNKRTQDLQEVLDSCDLDVPRRLVELLPSLTPEKQADLLMRLMDFLYPKRKAIEQSIALDAHRENLSILSDEEIRSEINKLIELAQKD
jgi:hypothetical protein